MRHCPPSTSPGPRIPVGSLAAPPAATIAKLQQRRGPAKHHEAPLRQFETVGAEDVEQIHVYVMR